MRNDRSERALKLFRQQTAFQYAWNRSSMRLTTKLVSWRSHTLRIEVRIALPRGRWSNTPTLKARRCFWMFTSPQVSYNWMLPPGTSTFLSAGRLSGFVVDHRAVICTCDRNYSETCGRD